VSLSLYDTAQRGARPFEPLVDGQVSLYLCGATVQAPPHIGHLRSAVAFDVAVRWFAARGYAPVFIRNVTDIDDKILAKAAAGGEPFWALAARNEAAFAAGYDALGCLRPTYEPRATGHIPEMVGLMQRLVELGHAYTAAGDVYFSVASWPDYGVLSGQRPDSLQAAPDGGEGKRDPRDFALWKAAKPGEPFWETPWGPGRPGWHLECSAMAERYLGPSFDVHGGGLDLVFPHHENELAQSAAAGDPFARYWLHNGWVTTAGEKMSKSLGNSLLVDAVLGDVRAVELRYYLGGAHYRSHMEYSPAALAEAGAAWRRVESFLQRAAAAGAGAAPAGPAAVADLPAAFTAAMDDDLGVPAALAVVHDRVRAGNQALDAGEAAVAATAAGDVARMLAVLGLDPSQAPWADTRAPADLVDVVDVLVAGALAERAAARERRDFAAADAVRDRLAAAGVDVEDTPAGPRWSVRAR